MRIDQSKSQRDKVDRGDDLEDLDRFMLRPEPDDYTDYKYDALWGQKGWFKPSCIPISIILVLIVLVVLLPLLDAADKNQSTKHPLLSGGRRIPQFATADPSASYCRMTLVESIPEGLVYENITWSHPSTYSVWASMIASANSTIEIGSYYWSLRDGDIHSSLPSDPSRRFNYPGSDKGEAIFSSLLSIGQAGKVSVRIAQNEPSKDQPNLDTDLLVRKQAAKVVNVNMPKLVGSGILHTKMWIVDRKSAYIGSANLDWRSLTQVKELGIYIDNCTNLVNDISKIFYIYWKVGVDGKIPEIWPSELETTINASMPLPVVINMTDPANAYIASSPPQLCTPGRTTDIDSILDTIHKADRYIYISVMDYIPMMIYTARPKFWPVIDDALRMASIDRRIEIRMLISQWKHTKKAQNVLLDSLRRISNSYSHVKITVRLFTVPADEEQSKIPFARVNHNKYMVTDNTAYIGTSNWSGDYFTVTGGVGVIIEGNTTIRQQLEDVFLRDWNSKYSSDLSNHL